MAPAAQIGRLEATLAAANATIADVRSRLSATETKLEVESAAKVFRSRCAWPWKVDVWTDNDRCTVSNSS
jgi:hypothetical protein